jgi:hypothetical protein
VDHYPIIVILVESVVVVAVIAIVAIIAVSVDTFACVTSTSLA